MVEFDWAWTRRDGVTFVSVRVHNDGVARRVCVESRLDGPVWPPRREGVPEAGWTDEGFEGVVGGGETRAMGFATPAEPADPPVTITGTERADGDCDDAGPHHADVPAVDATAASVVRALGDPVVPRDAVPDRSAGVDTDGREADSPDDSRDGDSPDDSRDTDTIRGAAGASETGTEPTATLQRAGVPPAVRQWLAAVEHRRRVADGGASADGEPAEHLAAAVRADAHALAAVRRRLDALATGEQLPPRETATVQPGGDGPPAEGR
jgi:hypothetical protein